MATVSFLHFHKIQSSLWNGISCGFAFELRLPDEKEKEKFTNLYVSMNFSEVTDLEEDPFELAHFDENILSLFKVGNLIDNEIDRYNLLHIYLKIPRKFRLLMGMKFFNEKGEVVATWQRN